MRSSALALAATLAVTGCSMMGPKQPVSGVYSENQVTRSATVTKIDLDKRLVTLRNADDKVVVVKCGPEVKNLPQLKVGDQVNATYYESIAYEVHKPGELTDMSTQAASGVATAPPGSKPGAVAADIVRLTATIVSIDKATPSVTLRTDDGQLVAVKVLHPEKLDQISVGDVAEIFLSQAVAITVEPTRN
jgi:ABC-type Fe3+-hydroxamate transport system substrate-binding protein